MLDPEAPESLPKYLAEGIPKQDDDTLRDIQAYVEALLDSPLHGYERSSDVSHSSHYWEK
jgi:hypothetical protein